MMYSNRFVLAVMINGETLREINGNVYLPFNTEYDLRLRNMNLLRAVAKVKIDGIHATPLDGGVVVPAGGTLDLKRFVIDGNLDTGRRFKFVKTSHHEVHDPFSKDNGIIEVTFELERSQPVQFVGYVDISPSWNSTTVLPTTFNRDSCSGVSYNTHNFSKLNSLTRCADTEVGATVPGSVSNQKFVSTWIDTDPATKQTLRLRLVPTGDQSQPVTVANTRWVYCPSCRGKCKSSAKFCQHCGANLKELLV